MFQFWQPGPSFGADTNILCPNRCAPFDCQRFPFPCLSSLPSHCLHSSIMSATCHAKCPLICLWRSLRNLHFICTTCDPDELSPFPIPLAPLSLCLPDCSQLPLRIQFFIFMRRLDCPPASGINAFPSITLPASFPPHLCTISGWRLSFDLCLASLLSLSLSLCVALFGFKCLQVICRVALCCEFSFCCSSFFGAFFFLFLSVAKVSGDRKTQMTRVSCASGCFAAC